MPLFHKSNSHLPDFNESKQASINAFNKYIRSGSSNRALSGVFLSVRTDQPSQNDIPISLCGCKITTFLAYLQPVSSSEQQFSHIFYMEYFLFFCRAKCM